MGKALAHKVQDIIPHKNFKNLQYSHERNIQDNDRASGWIVQQREFLWYFDTSIPWKDILF